MDDSRITAGQIVLTAVVFEGGLAVIAVALGWLFGHDPLAHLSWTWPSAAWGLAATLPPLVLLLWCAASSWEVCRAHMRLMYRIVGVWFAQASWLDLALISIAAGVGEELLFRGFLQAALGSWLHPWVGLVVASVIFGLAHYITRLYGIIATLLGFYLGGLWLVCDNLLAPMITHALYDFLALVYLVHKSRATAFESN